ncbi:hypothetical protein [Parasporobacterium paucivorans]|uniref:Uncharacterized protein n=1 Tax=Parasporobacterium paucivorans DSM 15970 TaxID=1122934 RepID=A0A1M6GL09_9FIRM|nr:hypothetical protein [Parasporobacterium paucivorans]SHJ10603.1 hypothetical protein SAMN02745691_01353 [Parasporobacterium paucivorans DSM 15970]
MVSIKNKLIMSMVGCLILLSSISILIGFDKEPHLVLDGTYKFPGASSYYELAANDAKSGSGTTTRYLSFEPDGFIYGTYSTTGYDTVVISEMDGIINTEYTISGDLLIPEEYSYVGFIPLTDRFDAVCTKDGEELRFSADGQLSMGNTQGSYERSGDLLKCRINGCERYFVIYQNRINEDVLCRTN